MIVELRKKSQITLPKEIVSKLHLETGDHFDVREKNGVIYLIPVSIYPKKYIDDLNIEIDSLKDDLKSGKEIVFDNVDNLLKKLG